jgi:hypothetical protein
MTASGYRERSLRCCEADVAAAGSLHRDSGSGTARPPHGVEVVGDSEHDVVGERILYVRPRELTEAGCHDDPVRWCLEGDRQQLCCVLKRLGIPATAPRAVAGCSGNDRYRVTRPVGSEVSGWQMPSHIQMLAQIRTFRIPAHLSPKIDETPVRTYVRLA